MSSSATEVLMKAPEFRLDGKRALVTGGSRGIGLAAAFALANAGANVTIAARDKTGLDQACELLGRHGLVVSAMALDVTDPVAVSTAVPALGAIHVLVNNAGGNRPGLLRDMSANDMEAVLALNVTSSMLVSQAVIDGLVAAGQPGSIINLSSQYGHIGAPERALYSAAKHGVEGYTKSLAWEVGRHGIRVNTIAPSMIETDMTKARLAEPGVREMFASKSALDRIGQPADLMGAIVFLASDASSYITGASIRVDGGTTAV
ncbi:SDR family NAD(P)-dependent oxidoreductase [Orrella daihaiensis]|uniref:SDR family NAD(P)-dependent oxidoreductase n=1 Tax=Orrella daihaiensis TaxID=2782176 RepID=UPI0035101325